MMSIQKTKRAVPGTLAATLLLTVLLTACATAGATFRSGVGDAFLEHPPWYTGAPVATGDSAGRMGHLPVAYQRGATQPAMFDPAIAPGSPTGLLLADLDAYLDSLSKANAVSIRLVEGGKVSAVSSRLTTSPPDVQFGCITEDGTPWGDCAVNQGGALGRGRQQMRLAVGRPSAEWIGWMSDVMRDQGVGRALVITLEVGQYQMRQRGILGTKEVEVGTGHTVGVPWMTSLETPVMVLQLTGALVGPDGKAIRIGSEGFAVKRTPLVASALGAQALFSDDDVQKARAARRDDLAGNPLAWQVAMRHLVAQLTGRRDLAP